MNLILKKYGNCLTLEMADMSPLSPSLIDSVNGLLSYDFKKRERTGITTETRYMASVTDDGRMVFPVGFLNKIVPFLKNSGNHVWFKDGTPDEYKKTAKPVLEILDNTSFRPRQRECVDAILNSPCGVIKAPTGFGKTFILGTIVKAFPNSKIHVCTKSAKLAKDIRSRLLSFDNSVGLVGGGSRDLDRRVTVFTADSLGYSSGDAEFFFYDECHTAPAPSYLQKIFNIYNYSKRFGLTATPKGRSDGADALLEALFGPIVFDMSYGDAVEGGLISPMKVRWLSCHNAPPRGIACKSQVYRNRYCIWENDTRNKLIADDVMQNYEGKKALILVSTVRHAFELKRLLPDFEICYSTITPDLLSELKAEGTVEMNYKPLNAKDKKKLFEDFVDGKVRNVIATDVWSTGVDVPDLEVVYNVSGRVSKILTTQGAGRASRLFVGKDFGQVVDIFDWFASDYIAFSNARKKTYKELGWEQSGLRDRQCRK